MAFQLHPRLLNDTLFIVDLKLSRVLLMNDQRFPWLILVPRHNHIKEIYELELNDQTILLSEITQVSKMLQLDYSADKLNIAALGNLVPQLHIHIIARMHNDAAWPAPVWGFENSIPYSPESVKTVTEHFRTRLSRS